MYEPQTYEPAVVEPAVAVEEPAVKEVVEVKVAGEKFLPFLSSVVHLDVEDFSDELLRCLLCQLVASKAPY